MNPDSLVVTPAWLFALLIILLMLHAEIDRAIDRLCFLAFRDLKLKLGPRLKSQAVSKSDVSR